MDQVFYLPKTINGQRSNVKCKQDNNYQSTTKGFDSKNFFVEHNGVKYAGIHLLIDFWDANNLDDETLVTSTLKLCVEAIDATLLHIHTHKFEPNGGLSGVAVLMESHISIHTWPETGYAAFDIFTCGDTQPLKAIEILQKAFKPKQQKISTQFRGKQN